MVHTRNRSNYSIQADRCGQGRGKTRARSGKSSSRRTFLEEASVAPHSPGSVPTNFYVNSEPEIIEGNIVSAEPFPSFRNRNISVTLEKLVQSSKIRGVGNIPKPLAGAMNSYIHIKSFLVQEKTIELLGGAAHCLAKTRPEERIGNDSSFGERRPSSVYQLQTSCRGVQRQAHRTSEEEERSQEPSRKGQRQMKLQQTLTTVVENPQIGAFSSGQCLQYCQASYGIHRQGAGKDEQYFCMQIIPEIQFVKTSISVEIGQLDAKLTKITLDINDLKKNNKHSAELHKSTTSKFEIISNKCDRMESKYQVKDYEMEDLSTSNINDQLKVLKNHSSTVVDNTNQFSIHLARSDSERQKLKDEILAHVEKIHNIYEPNPHMPRQYASLTE
ncbi:hypothetical protein O181_016734 [Austropuccinia psidii MF-1]|uniref:Uncharacterized protein n=1 Tax=Austropuccinia psidii MF-1 TaxID=1389203 RepID=A0A9Q3C4H1_9BASI|nr:hypothetical protein [Austropuccinia psidii MF-1]